jgi:hypothetical protein
MKKIVYPNLVAEMARHGHNQKTIGKLIGRSDGNVSTRFLGKKDWTISEIEKICELYNKSYEELFKRGE